MKTIAVIGANKPLEPFYQQILGKYRIIGIAWEEGAICKKYCDVFYPISFSDKERVLEVCKKEKIDGITSFSLESALPTVIYVAQNMNLVSNSFECQKLTETKYSQRNCFRENGIPTPNFYLIKEKKELQNIKISFPVIIKPIDNGGSRGINYANSLEELEYLYDDSILYSKSGKVIVEEYIDGREFSVEYISHKGIHYNVQITDKITSGMPHFVELEHHQPADISLYDAQRIKCMVEKALTALKIKNSASHTEIKLNSKGELFIIEIGARMGGGMITSDLVRLSTGYDFVRGVVDLSIGEFQPPQFTSTYYSGIYFYTKLTKKVKDIIISNDNDINIIEKHIDNNPLEETTSNFQRNGYFIYQSNHKFLL